MSRPLRIEYPGDIKHRSHAVHPLDNIGDRLGLDRVNEPDEDSEEWYPSMMFIPGRHRWDARGCLYKEVEQGGSGEMDQDIDQVVAQDPVLVEIVVEGEADISDRTIGGWPDRLA